MAHSDAADTSIDVGGAGSVVSDADRDARATTGCADTDRDSRDDRVRRHSCDFCGKTGLNTGNAETCDAIGLEPSRRGVGSGQARIRSALAIVLVKQTLVHYIERMMDSRNRARGPGGLLRGVPARMCCCRNDTAGAR